jgi:amino acid adenylation domain-containing protein
LPKSIECILADIGVSLSGNTYMNLDVKSPSERIINIISAINPEIVIVNNQTVSVLEAFKIPNIEFFNIDDIDLVDNVDEKLVLKKLDNIVDTDPLCIINTSGSTGTPKGVVLNHRSYVNYTNWAISTFTFNSSLKLGVLSPSIFDHFNYEISLMMMKGVELVLLDNNMAMFPIKLLQILEEQEINYIFWVPTIMVNIANMNLLSDVKLSSLKMIWFAGEVFPTKQFNYWRSKLPNTVFVNLYGPTEATVDCTYYIVQRDLSDDEPIPIGYPCRNTDVLIIDENNQLVVGEEEGELCIRGTSLAMGYYNNPEKTAEVFVQNPLNRNYPEIVYRTGDIVSRNQYGELVFKGRKDTLVKHFGYRIELGEIEHVILNNLKMVQNVCILYNQNKKEIVMIYQNLVDLDISLIRSEISRVLPKYMIPTVFFRLENLPMNASGKIDRKELSKMYL